MKNAVAIILCVALAACSQTAASQDDTSSTKTAGMPAAAQKTAKNASRQGKQAVAAADAKVDACTKAVKQQQNAAMLGAAFGMVGGLGGFAGQGGAIAGQVASTAGSMVAQSQASTAQAAMQRDCM